MPAAITPTTEHGSLPANRQTDLDEAWMDGGTSPLWPLLQALINRSEFSIFANANRLLGNGEFSVDPGGTNSTFAVNVPAILAAPLYDAASEVYVPLLTGPATIGASKIEGGGNLANSTWYYVYVFSNAGVIDYEISTTAPSSSRVHKAGSGAALARVYLGCFRTLSTGAPIPVRASRGVYRYRVSGCAVADLKVLDGASATSYTAVDCSALVPPHARLATFRASLVSTTGIAMNYAYVQTNGDTGLDAFELHVEAVNASSDNLVFDCETDSSQNVQYKVTNSTSAPDLYLWVNGFYE